MMCRVGSTGGRQAVSTEGSTGGWGLDRWGWPTPCLGGRRRSSPKAALLVMVVGGLVLLDHESQTTYFGLKKPGSGPNPLNHNFARPEYGHLRASY